MANYFVIYTTTSNSNEAENIATGLVKEGLAACVNIVPSIKSVYIWKGEICNDHEVLLIIKSPKPLLGKVIQWVKKHHSYETPEIIALPIVDGSKDYLKWLSDSCPDKG